MAHAEKCPVCDNQQPHQVESEYDHVTCRGCGGKGWIEVQDTVVQQDILGKSHLVSDFMGCGTTMEGDL